MAQVAAALPKLARAVKTATGADGLRLVQFNEAPAGQTVFHLHFHLIPIYEGVELGRGTAMARRTMPSLPISPEPSPRSSAEPP